MSTMSRECPTEILIDIDEDEKYVSDVTKKEAKTSLTIVESKSMIGSLSSERNERNETSKSTNINETILDISPSRICGRYSDKSTIMLEIDLEKNLKSEISNGCPTAVLIDISPPTDVLNEYKTLNMENKDSSERLDKSSNVIDDYKTGGSSNSSNSSEVEMQMAFKRLRWKTPSPKSMSRISKEASKIVDCLHSSSIFDEDLLLTEEILPVTLNFDELDDIDEGNSDDNICENVILNHGISVREQSLSKIEKNEKKLNSNSSSDKIQDNLKTDIIEESSRVSSKNENSSKESYSSEIHSSSPDNSGFLTHPDEVDDVFTVAHIASEDKENVQIENKVISSTEYKIGSKIASKNLSVNRSKLDCRGTLRNLSNIKQDVSTRRLSLSVNKNVTTPLRRMTISGNKKGTMPHTEKPQIKKTTFLSVDHHSALKGFSQSKTFQFRSPKELTASAQKTRPTAKFGAGCSSSNVKQQNNVFATPSRRYSICTPLKSSSAVKPPLTPAIMNSHDFVFPKYTPQPTRPSRLSFSRSLQQSGDNSKFFPSRGFKQPISTTVPGSASKVSSGIKNPSKTGKLSFSQSMTSVPLRTSFKGRFSSKGPSPLSLEKDKKVVRALFTNVSEK